MKWTALACIWVATGALMAQNDMYANVNLQFRLDNPGARAHAMGGAFVGLADDTTAIFANPAGLTQMVSSTFVVDLGHTRNDHDIPFYGGEIRRVGSSRFSIRLGKPGVFR